MQAPQTTSSFAPKAPDGSPAGSEIGFRSIVRLAVDTLPYLKPAWPELRVIIALMVVVGVLAIPAGLLFNHLLQDALMNAKPVSPLAAKLLRLDVATFVQVERLSTAARAVVRDRIVWCVTTCAVVALAAGLFVYARWLQLRQRIEQALRVQMVARVQSMSMRYHAEARVGDEIFRAYQDNAMITNMMWTLLEPWPRLFGLLSPVVICWLIERRLGLALLGSYATTVVINAAFTPYLRRSFRAARERGSVVTSRVQESIACLKVIKAYGAEARFLSLFEQESRAAFASSYRARAGLVVLMIAVYTASSVVMLWATGVLSVAAREARPLPNAEVLKAVGFSVWSLGAYAYAMGRLGSGVDSASLLTETWARVQNTAIGMSRVFEHARMAPEVGDAAQARVMPGLQRSIEFRGVRFAYSPDRPVLRGVDLQAQRGTITAIVGPSGSGKSTLMSLLLRLFDPDEGAILVDGVDLREYSVASLRANVSIALQENILFGTSIRENIRYAVPEASDAQVRAAAEVACAHEFISAEAQGYDTLLGERGSKLSTGQRQRLSIARAIIKDTPILILDEPTASLDADTEMRVLQNLAGWGAQRAIFLVTHRLSTIRRADQIAFLSEGVVVETGTHAELMAKPDSRYRRFVELEEANAAAAQRAQTPELVS